MNMAERIIVPPEPCPRCGNRAHIVYLGLNYGYVECIPCEIRTRDGQIDNMIEEWNKGGVDDRGA